MVKNAAMILRVRLRVHKIFNLTIRGSGGVESVAFKALDRMVELMNCESVIEDSDEDSCSDI